ncbi:MAG TPA: beta-ketoacyl-ACP synthase III [Polyangiaceae bacterium]|jgi:3-oxoacyl-[acyl-carrier-protein] synthase-3
MPPALPRSRILGTGSYLPPGVRTNHDIEKMVETSDAWITERTGIKERRVAPEGIVTSDMATAAAKAALEMAGLKATDLDMIIVGTVTPDMPMPATAVFVQQKLGAGVCPAFDLSAACAGFVFGLSVADQFIATGQMRHVLVVGVELLSRVTNWTDRTTCILFGDGAGAVVLGPADVQPGEAKPRGLLSTSILTDGSLASALRIPGGGTAAPTSHETVDQQLQYIHMKGQDVFKVAVKNLLSASRSALARAGMTQDDIDWICAHQANKRIIDQVVARVEVPPEKVLMNIERVGNTSSASIPILMDESYRAGKIKAGDTVLMCALGAGISWGSAIVRL